MITALGLDRPWHSGGDDSSQNNSLNKQATNFIKSIYSIDKNIFMSRLVTAV